MLTKTSKLNKQGLLRRFNTCSRGLGLDIGQLNTKIVIAKKEPTGVIQYQGVIVPTILTDSPTEPPSTRSEQLPSVAERRQTRSLTSEADKNHQFQLSTRTIKRLASRISQVVASDSLIARSRVGMTLSMAVCDYRTLYVPKTSRLSVTGVQQSIAAATGDNRARCLAVMPGHDLQDDNRQTKVRCFSLPEDLVCTMAHHLESIGLMPHTLTGIPWCMANALEMVLPPEESSSLQVGIDWNYGQPLLVSVKQGEIDYVRCLSSGSLRELTASAADQYGLAPSAVGRWLAHCMGGPERLELNAIAAETRNWVREACRRFASEISTALEFIRWRNQDAKLETIWLMGGVPEIAGMAELLQSMLACEVRPWRLDAGNSALTADYALAASLAWMGTQHA